MACICVNEPMRFLSGGSCFHDTDDFPLRLATGVFNLVCALHAAADGSEVESDRELHGCLVTISERLFILSGRHSPPGNTRDKKSGRQSVAENPFAHAEDRMACNDHFTLLNRVSATLLAVSDARSGHGQSRPSPDAGEWRSDGRAELDGAERTYCRRVRAMPAFGLAGDRLSRRPCGYGESLLQGREYSTPQDHRAKERRGVYLPIWRTLRRFQAAM